MTFLLLIFSPVESWFFSYFLSFLLQPLFVHGDGLCSLQNIAHAYVHEIRGEGDTSREMECVNLKGRNKTRKKNFVFFYLTCVEFNKYYVYLKKRHLNMPTHTPSTLYRRQDQKKTSARICVS